MVLVVASSSCQLYSGTGRALFDWMQYAAGALDFALLTDTGEAVNLRAAIAACRRLGTAIIPSGSGLIPGCPDNVPLATARVLGSRHWDVIECLSWASAATNTEVLANRPPGSKLVFTPHTQPIWTLAEPQRQFMVQPALQQMLRASDIVLADTPHEAALLRGQGLRDAAMLQIPLGVDVTRFCPLPDRASGDAPRLLAVADFREHRKRSDLLIKTFEAVLAERPDVTPVLAGRDSDKLTLPPLLAARAKCLGYVTEDALLREFQLAHTYVLLSDFEAFGLPIAEALCCGTQAIIHNQAETASMFGGMPGVTTVENTDTQAVRDAILAALAAPLDRAAIAAAAAERFSFAVTYGRKLDRVLAMLGR